MKTDSFTEAKAMNPDLPAQLRVTPANATRWIVVGQLLDAKNRRVLQKAHLVYDQNHILHVGTEAPEAAILNGQKTPDLTLP